MGTFRRIEQNLPLWKFSKVFRLYPQWGRFTPPPPARAARRQWIRVKEESRGIAGAEGAGTFVVRA